MWNSPSGKHERIQLKDADDGFLVVSPHAVVLTDGTTHVTVRSFACDAALTVADAALGPGGDLFLATLQDDRPGACGDLVVERVPLE